MTSSSSNASSGSFSSIQTQTIPSYSSQQSQTATATSSQTIDDLVQKAAALSLQESKKETLDGKETKAEPSEAEVPKTAYAKYKIIKNVHDDDIHMLLRLSDSTFVSGSKDGNLRLWNTSGELVKTVYEQPKVDYTQWITALGRHASGDWISGTRDGYVDRWTPQGTHVASLQIPPKTRNPALQCKARNRARVLAITPIPNSTVFAMGRPTQFTIHSNTQGTQLSYHQTSKNDWTYALHPLSNQKMLVVTGATLSLWKSTDTAAISWKPTAQLVTEGRSRPGTQRLFISAITPLATNNNHFGLSIFDGRVAIYDLVKQQKTWEAQEHTARVWTIENITPQCFASCADDGYIKLWDARQSKKSITSLLDNEAQKARVSVLMKIDDSSFLSGSCPDDVFKSKTKAQFSFWSLKKL